MFEYPVLDEAAVQNLAEPDAQRAVYRLMSCTNYLDIGWSLTNKRMIVVTFRGDVHDQPLRSPSFILDRSS